MRELAWAADGKGFFVKASQPRWRVALLYVTLAGKINPLTLTSDFMDIRNLLPSPDGKFLTFEASGSDSNVWMIDNF
jgi:hypothetical protein